MDSGSLTVTSRLPSSLCFWCWRTGYTDSSLMICSQVGWMGNWGRVGAGTGGGLMPCPHVTADSAQDLAAELVHYGFVHEVCRLGVPGREGTQGGPRPSIPQRLPPALQDDRTKLATFLESTFLKYRGAQL